MNKKILLKNTHISVFFALVLLFPFYANAFDWPQKIEGTDSIHSYYAQLRGDTIANSLVFKENKPVTAAENGKMLIFISEHDDDFQWFESTLGNAVMIYHENQMVTVYGNLDSSTLVQETLEKPSVKKGETIAESGNSGWQDGQSCLEFQVFDAREHSSINPKVLMPAVEKELALTPGEVTIEDKEGKIYSAENLKNLKSGDCSIYFERQKLAVPYKTILSVNGAVAETISYDVLKEKNGRLCVQGNSFYSIEKLYPDNKRQLVSRLKLTSGKNKISVILADISGKRKNIEFTVDVR